MDPQQRLLLECGAELAACTAWHPSNLTGEVALQGPQPLHCLAPEQPNK